MPKLGSVGRIRSKAAAASVRASALLSKEVCAKSDVEIDKDGKQKSTTIKDLDDEENGNTLSRGQKKRLAKREQYAKREKMILSSLRIQRAEQQRKRIDGMDALKEALNEAMETADTKPHYATDEGPIPVVQVKGNHSKRVIAQKEIQHMHLVLQHPSFVQQPFETMQEHLRNTFSSQAKELQKKADDVRKREKEQSLQRKEVRKGRIREAKFDAAKAYAKRKRM